MGSTLVKIGEIQVVLFPEVLNFSWFSVLQQLLVSNQMIYPVSLQTTSRQPPLSHLLWGFLQAKENVVYDQFLMCVSHFGSCMLPGDLPNIMQVVALSILRYFSQKNACVQHNMTKTFHLQPKLATGLELQEMLFLNYCLLREI